MEINQKIAYMGAVIALMAFLACDPSRPTSERWQEAWNEAKAAVPDPKALENDGSREPCSELLVATRTLRGRLLPSPDAALDGPIEAWLERAAGIGFDCPTAQHQLHSYHEAVRELAVLSAEIDAGLARTENLEGDFAVPR